MDNKAFFTDLKKSINDTHDDLVNLTRKRDEIQRRVDDGIFAKDYGNAEVAAVKREMEKVLAAGEKNVYGIIAKRIEELEAADVLKPDELNGDAELLKFDVLSQKDIDHLAKRNSENPTVSRLIARYAEMHGFKVEVPTYMVQLVEDKRVARDMQEVVKVALKWVGDEKRGRSVIDRLFVGYGV